MDHGIGFQTFKSSMHHVSLCLIAVTDNMIWLLIPLSQIATRYVQCITDKLTRKKNASKKKYRVI